MTTQSSHTKTQLKKSLAQLLQPYVTLESHYDRMITGLTIDSRQVQAGDVFLARPGLIVDGRSYIQQAIERGAVAIIAEAKTESQSIMCHKNNEGIDIPEIALPTLNRFIGPIASSFYDNPSHEMLVAGFTGTNGKTSCSQWYKQISNEHQKACGVIGTLGYGVGDILESTLHTTPEALDLQKMLAEFRDHNAKSVALEVSSHALVQRRVSGVEFDIAVFTNLTRDHLDYHVDMASYAAAKRSLFEQPGLRHGVINANDKYGYQFIKDFRDQLEVIAYGLDVLPRDLKDIPQVIATDIELYSEGYSAKIQTPWGEGKLSSRLLGRFNLSNQLAVIAALGLSGLALSDILSSMAQIENIPGRMQPLGGEQHPLIVVDYAHTPDALEKALQALREHCSGELWCVFGCGGDRDRGKRADMAKAVECYADHTIITDDNPRGEDPRKIVEDILQGIINVSKVVIEHNRARAISYAIEHAQAGDIVLIAGKGHEDYQEIDHVKRPFSDVMQVKALLG